MSYIRWFFWLTLIWCLACLGAAAQAPQKEPAPQADAGMPPAPDRGPAADALGSPSEDEPGASASQADVARAGPSDEPRDVPDAPACTPTCRRGFVCKDGECVSACNPPCQAGERCTAQRTCELRRSEPPPPPQGYTSEAPQPGPSGAGQGVSGKHTHDGFFLRLTLGFGGASVKQSGVPGLGGVGSTGDVTFSGVSGFFSVDLGAAVIDSLILQGRISAMVLVDPAISVDGEELGDTMDTSLSFAILGAGATYYFMPLNLYLTGIVGLANARLETAGVAGESDTGVGVELDIGKEWWVGDDWGLGVAGRFQLARVPDSGDSGEDFPITGFSGGVLFSVTYN